MIAKVSFNIEPDRYNEFCLLLGQFAETFFISDLHAS